MMLYGGRSRRSISSTTSETVVVPDSTTKDMGGEFCTGQDVLLKQKDGRYYLGTVVEVDSIREQCLVKFGDNTDSWSSFKDLTKLNTPKQEDLLCVVCKKSAPKNKKEITVCDKCGRGYHRKCHQPEIPGACQKEDVTWVCKRCTNSVTHRLRRSESRLRNNSIQNAASSNSNIEIPLQTTRRRTKVLPYDLNSLSWDTYHRVNAEHVYCYCGRSGEWYKQMLQCARCRQWFHEKCMDSLLYPVYCGDRFYVFVCSICNHGTEFLRRLEMKWVDLVHLMLFNLTAFNSKKYYDLDTIIIPYLNDNWHALQLPPKILGVNKTERREIILSILTNNRNRFKCGREIKKRATIWGLRVRLPPPAPTITLPTAQSGKLSESELKEMWQGNRRLQFLPLLMKNDSNTKFVPHDNHMRNIMMGVSYLQQSNNNNPSETDSPCPSPDNTIVGQELDNNEKLFIDNIKNNEYIGAGCVKKSVPFTNLTRKRLLSVNGSRERILRKPKRRNTNDGIYRLDEFQNLDKNFKSNEALPLTPPTSVSAPPTPPASGSNSLLSDLSTDFSSEPFKTNKLSKIINNIQEVGELNTPCDTSGDETSSKSTLDLIIPPPKDFEGKNNPFLALLKGNNTTDEQLPSKKTGKKHKKNDSITLPLPLTAVIPGKPVMRPKKRQLSEKDIFIGPNGEVKRRRLRRNNRNFTSRQQTTASKTATVVPVRPDAKEWGQTATNQSNNNTTTQISVDYALNGRRLRQRPDKQQQQQQQLQQQDKEKNPTPSTSTVTTPTKQSPVKEDLDDLKSSVNIYFGAANRIASGEPYTVKAKRIGPTGKLEYLIEWDSPGNVMT